MLVNTYESKIKSKLFDSIYFGIDLYLCTWVFNHLVYEKILTGETNESADMLDVGLINFEYNYYFFFN